MSNDKRMEKTHIILEGRTIPLSICRHRAARRISLRLSAARDGVIMTLPLRASIAKGLDFVTTKARWVITHLETDEHIAFEDGAIIPVGGQNVVIRRIAGRGISELSAASPEREEHALRELQVHCAPEFISRRVQEFLKKYLREICFTRAQTMAKLIGKTVHDVRVSNTRSRWGSCSHGGRLTFHWQLIFASSEILEYLIAHEVAHLQEMNHSAKFWKIVSELCPHYISARKWLRREGHVLHRYGK